MTDKRTKSRRDRFERVFNRRKTEAMKSIKQLAKCADKHNYLFTMDEVNKARKELELEIDKCFFGFQFKIYKEFEFPK